MHNLGKSYVYSCLKVAVVDSLYYLVTNFINFGYQFFCWSLVIDIKSITHGFLYFTLQEEELYEIDIPLRFIASVGTRVHGLACWFDVLFNGRYSPKFDCVVVGLLFPHFLFHGDLLIA